MIVYWLLCILTVFSVKPYDYLLLILCLDPILLPCHYMRFKSF